MDVHDRLDEISTLVEEAKSMPFSASAVVNRAQILDLLDEVRALLPESLRTADLVLDDREALVEEGRLEAERLVEDARAEQARLVSEHEIYRIALAEGDALRADSAEDAARMRREVDDYVDAKLAHFEVVLTNTLRTVERGRERIRSRVPEDDYADEGDPVPS